MKSSPHKNADQYVNDFINEIKQYPWYEKEKTRIKAACTLAKKVHNGKEIKRTGEPYISHPLAVAVKIYHKTHDIECLIAGILHDVVNDNHTIEIEHIYNTFGNRVGFLVDTVSEKTLSFRGKRGIFCADKIEKILRGGMKDVAGLILKITDREHNLDSVDGLDQQKQVRMSFESQAIYIPLRRILGYNDESFSLESAKNHLDDYCKKNTITDHKGLKKSLMNEMFRDFDNETFIYSYSHSNKIIWKMNDKSTFYEMVQDEGFEKAIDIIKMEQMAGQNGQIGNFTVEFAFIRGIRSMEHTSGKYYVSHMKS